MRFREVILPLSLMSILVTGLVLATSAPPESDAQRLVGVWRGGWPYQKEPIYEIVIMPDKITGRNLLDGSSLGEGTYVIDPARHTIDATRTDAGRPRKYLGIYALNGDRLKWCSNDRTSKRPSELSHNPADDRYLLVLTRQSESSIARRPRQASPGADSPIRR